MGCSRDAPDEALFELLPPEETGVTFRNDLPDDPELNILNYLYYYNGGGVAVGDVDGNGYPDLFFTANLGPDRLYLNHGNYRFEDVTERAGVAGPDSWTSGATMADVNGDGALDIYVSGVDYLSSRGGNILYVNNGDGTFTDRTTEYGLEYAGYSTQALFVDYDADGDLDLYLLNHSTHDERGTPRNLTPHPTAGDRLFRNDGNHFVDVTRAAGILSNAEGYGLGVVASDLNGDGCIDIYVANDFEGDDLYYRNNCDGTFTESLREAMGHTSRFSMGVDAADFNNDLRPDVYVADMLPTREEILKTSANAESFRTFQLRQQLGYHPQYARNTLQLNRGDGRFSEIGYFAGVHATDWSWATLFADLDNDGLKDLFVTNGIFRRPNDLDYIQFVGQASVQRSLAAGITRENLAVRDHMPQVAIPNFAFHNNGDLTFTDMAEAWGLGQAGFSNGAAYVDLNNSGALDLVVNNIGAPASIYRNRAREIGGNHYLKVSLRGSERNTAGIGAKVIVRHGDVTQMAEQVPTRGFQSSVDPRVHFGLGAAERVDSLVVIWPDRRFQVLTAVPADTTLTLSQEDAAGDYFDAVGGELGLAGDEGMSGDAQPVIQEVPLPQGLAYAHEENEYFDFNREPLMPHMVSREGPALAVGDVNGDGLDDVFLGGAKWQPSRLLAQRPDGSFLPISEATFRADSLHEDVDAAFFDANGDGALDLYVVSGGNEFWGNSEALLDRLYLNDGQGEFTRVAEALPPMFENGSVVAPGDFDGDGDTDLFVGGRVVARAYGQIPRSYLLRNDGGRFTDVTDELAPELRQVGMVTSATWLQSGQNGPRELVVVGEWMPVRLFRVEGGRLVERTEEVGLAGTEGWWNHAQAADLDGDGREDLVLGNLGLNSYIRGSAEQPVRMFVGDFARTGQLQQIITLFHGQESYPLLGRDELLEAIPPLRERFPTYASFGASQLDEILTPDQIESAEAFEARQFASSVALRDENGRFHLQTLPAEAQFAPIYASLATDLTGDGVVDLLLGGNFSGVTPLRGAYDATYGVLLLGLGGGRFEAVDPAESGLSVEGEVRGMGVVRRPDGESHILIARNNDVPVLLSAAR